MTDTARPQISFDMVVLDTPDPAGLARFYCDLLGWQVTDTADDWVTIAGPSDARMAFQLAPDLTPPTWPEPDIPQQSHLDLKVSDLGATSAYAESIGARRVEGPDHNPNFVVFLDPSGHPFCLCHG